MRVLTRINAKVESMPRYTQSRLGPSSELVVTILTGLLAVILFVAIIVWPSAPKPDPAEALLLGETALGEQLTDATTQEYLQTLHRVKPHLSNTLHAEADKMIADGASEQELAMHVLSAYSDEMEGDYEHLLYADIESLDAIVDTVREGIVTLSNRQPDYCRMSTLETMMASDPERLALEYMAAFEYNSYTYHWTLNLNQQVLEAIESGRNAPQKYDRLSSGDMEVLQSEIEKMTRGPHVSKLMRLQTLSPSNQKRAMANMNFCDVAVEVLAGFSRFPKDTKERLLGEMQQEMSSDALQSIALGALGGF